MSQFLTNWSASWQDFTKFLTTFDFDRDPTFIGLWVVGLVVLAGLAVLIYAYDSVELGWFWKVFLVALRVAVLFLLLRIALLPQERAERVLDKPSRVAFLVDTSASMSIRDVDQASRPGQGRTRADQVRELFESSPLLETLSQKHEVSIYTFDSRLQLQRQFAEQTAKGPATAAPAQGAGPVAADKPWSEILKPTGGETRLGENLLDLSRQERDETLSALVVVTDGQSNAGLNLPAAAEALKSDKTRIIRIGVGSTEKPRNLQLADVQTPTHVHINDDFTIRALISAQGLEGKTAVVELLGKTEGEAGAPPVLQSKEAVIGKDGDSVSVDFTYLPQTPGRRQFLVRTKTRDPIVELVADDNQENFTVDVSDRFTKVLIVAGGPMRDYQFLCSQLNRDKSVELDVLLQTGVPGISQEAHEILFEFPRTREELFKYDVIVAFDPNWDAIRQPETKSARGELENGFTRLQEWVYSHAGGLILVAGEVYTPQLAATSGELRAPFEPLFQLYPVSLDLRLLDDDDITQPAPLDWTREGLNAGFLQLSDSAVSTASWSDFTGIFRCYPTNGVKAGSTVYARFNDPRSVSEPPVFLASQYYGSGRVLYIGSAEVWRLRSVDEDAQDRLWIKMVREVGQGRLMRGSQRALMLFEKKDYPVGATVPIRARVLDAQFHDYTDENGLTIEVTSPRGGILSPAPRLLPEKDRPGHYSGQFVVSIPGAYRIALPVPNSPDVVQETIAAKLPNLEFDHPEQNVSALKTLTGDDPSLGAYLPIGEAAAGLPALLPDRSTQKIEYEAPRQLWDQQFLIYLLVGVLSVEWLTRKLLKLA